jgi:broad specificity phosphatase PhoE
MTRVYMVRHGRAAAGWNVDPDPALDELGRTQSLAVAGKLSSRGPLPVVSSPLLRCQQTAFPLATAWKQDIVIEPLVGEIPSPEGYALEDRVDWLRDAMAGTWTQVGEKSGEHYVTYRNAIGDFVKSMKEDTVIFSHFIAINAVIGYATNNDNLMVARLDNCSITTFHIDENNTLTLGDTGSEATTTVG